MTYNEFSELLEGKVTQWIEEIKLDPVDLVNRNAVKKGIFEGVLICMTNEERQKMANRIGLKKEVVLTKFDGEDSI